MLVTAQISYLWVCEALCLFNFLGKERKKLNFLITSTGKKKINFKVALLSVFILTVWEMQCGSKDKDCFPTNKQQVIFKWEWGEAADEIAAGSVAAFKVECSYSPAASVQGKCPGRWVATHCRGTAALQVSLVCHPGGICIHGVARREGGRLDISGCVMGCVGYAFGWAVEL